MLVRERSQLWRWRCLPALRQSRQAVTVCTRMIWQLSRPGWESSCLPQPLCLVCHAWAPCCLVFWSSLHQLRRMRMDSLLLAPSCTAQQQDSPCSFQGQHSGLGSRSGLALEQQKQGNRLTCPFFSWEQCPLQPVPWFASLKGFLWATLSHGGVKPPTLALGSSLLMILREAGREPVTTTMSWSEEKSHLSAKQRYGDFLLHPISLSATSWLSLFSAGCIWQAGLFRMRQVCLYS